jgi:hypothetical protein
MTNREEKLEKKRGSTARFKSVEKSRKREVDPKKDGMSAKVLEMWVKETL